MSACVVAMLATFFFPERVLGPPLTFLRWLLGYNLANRLGLVPIFYVPDEIVFTFQTEDGPVTHYFNNQADRRAYMFALPGKWVPTRESGLPRHATDSETTAGVLLFSASDLGRFDGPDLIAKAATQIRRVYEKDLVG